MKSLRTLIVMLNDSFLDWVANIPLRHEKDPQKRFEIGLWLEIHSQTYDGMSNYKSHNYDKLASEDEKNHVRNSLLTMLKSDQYAMSKKAVIAYVCADIGVNEALQDVNYLRNQAENLSFEKQLLNLSYEALSRGITVHELIYGQHG